MAVFKIHRCLLLTTLLIAFCIIHNNSEAEAAVTTLLTKKSIDLPLGNSLIRTVTGSGVQIYECQQNSNATGLVYTSVGAKATLFSPDGICVNGNYTSVFSRDGNCVNGKSNSVGYHYFLSEPLALGGKPTFSFSVKAGEPISTIPESTVTCNALANKESASNEDVDDLLLKAVSHSQQGSVRGVSYVQRMHSRGGVAPSSACEEVGKQVQIPYTAQYLFWQQDRSLPMGIPAAIRVSEYFSPLFSFYGEGIQYYRFNGSSWINFNVSAYLYTCPGQEVVGWHYFFTKPDQNGGQPTWELFMPFSRVTVKVLSSITVDSDSIAWTKMEATSHGGNKNGLLQKVKYMQRVSTVGGLPPQTTPGSAAVGDEYTSPFSTIYWFYV